MVLALGIDLVEIKRIENAIKRFGRRFVGRILGENEIKSFDSRNDKAAFLAGRFAAKEAVIKSLGRFLKTRPSYSSIEILNDHSGNPVFSGKDGVDKIFVDKNCLVSISHEHHYATAVAMITVKQ